MKQLTFFGSRSATLVAIVISMLVSKEAFAAHSIFLEIDGIKGESTSAQGKDMIELLSFSHGTSMPMTSGPSNTSRASGRCVHQDFTVTAPISAVWPTLLLKDCAGESLKSVKLHVWMADASGAPIQRLQIGLENAVVTSVSYGMTADQPTMTVNFNYRKIQWDYLPHATPGAPVVPGKGANSASWSLDENKGK